MIAFTCTAPAEDVRRAVACFLDDVDAWLRAETGRSVADTAALAGYRATPDQGR